VDGLKLFPQMDVWSRYCVDPTLKESRMTVPPQTGSGPQHSALPKKSF
jgi:hypothetical protein